MSWFNKKSDDTTPSVNMDGDIPTIDGCAPSDRGIEVPSVDTGYITFEQYKAAKCSSYLKLLYEQEGATLISSGMSLNDMLEEGYKKDVLMRGLLRD